MQIQLHADHHTDGSPAMAAHLEATVRAALGRFGGRVTRVDAHLSDADGGDKAGAGAIHCLLDARLVGQDAVIVEQRADNAHQAIESGLRRLKRAVGAALARQDPRHHGAREARAARDALPDPA